MDKCKKHSDIDITTSSDCCKCSELDLISRQALKQALGINADDCDKCSWGNNYGRCKRGGDFEDACCAIDDAPPVKTEIIYCKDCKRHNISVEDVWDNPSLKWCPLVAHRGKAQGHEFDYQFCACAERKTDG